MANKHRGEVSFEANGKNYTLRYTNNALCWMEGALDKGFPVIFAELGDVMKLRMTSLRAVFWAGLRDEQPNVTIEEAGDLIAAAGGFLPVVQIINEAITKAFPDESGKANGSRPQMEAGTGTASLPPISKRDSNQNVSGN